MHPDRREPFINVSFRIEIDGLQGTGATEVIFPEARIVEPEEQRPLVQYGHLILRRGMTTSSEWYQWWDRARASGEEGRRNVTVVLLDRLRGDVARWMFAEARPCAYLVSPLNALGGEPLIETLELCVGGMKLAFGSR
jgi:tail tube protein gp19